MKNYLKVLFVIGMLTSGLANADLLGITLEDSCHVMRARLENQAFVLEMMKACMQRGNGVSDWTDADDQVIQCRHTAFQSVGGYSTYIVDDVYAKFLSAGSDPKTCKLPK